MISLERCCWCGPDSVSCIFIEVSRDEIGAAAILSNPDFMIRSIKSGQAGAGGVEIRSFIIHQRVATGLETGRLVRGLGQRVGSRGKRNIILFVFLGPCDNADNDAEENHETRGAANQGRQLFVVHHVELARVQRGLDLVAATALGVQVEDDGLGDEIASVVGAGDGVMLLTLSCLLVRA